MSVEVSTGNVWKSILSVGALGVPAVVLRFSDFHIISPVEAIIFGVAIVGGAFLFSWAAEVAQMDVSAALFYIHRQSSYFCLCVHWFGDSHHNLELT